MGQAVLSHLGDEESGWKRDVSLTLLRFGWCEWWVDPCHVLCYVIVRGNGET